MRKICVPMMYFPKSLSLLHAHFSDAPEKVILTAIAYLRITKKDFSRTSVVMGKTKLAPSHGHTISRLELCAALLATQVAQIVQYNLRMRVDKVRYFTNSRVVLGHLINRTRRFYTVERI